MNKICTLGPDHGFSADSAAISYILAGNIVQTIRLEAVRCYPPLVDFDAIAPVLTDKVEFRCDFMPTDRPSRWFRKWMAAMGLHPRVKSRKQRLRARRLYRRNLARRTASALAASAWASGLNAARNAPLSQP